MESSFLLSFFVALGVGLSGIDAKHPEDRFFFVAAITSRVDTNGGKLTTFAPAFNGEGRDSENLGNFRDSEKVREVV